MPKSYTPNWFFTALLDNHINQMMARYSCLRALRMDFFYRKDTPDFLQPDHRWLELQLRMLLEQDVRTRVQTDMIAGMIHTERGTLRHDGGCWRLYTVMECEEMIARMVNARLLEE